MNNGNCNDNGAMCQGETLSSRPQERNRPMDDRPTDPNQNQAREVNIRQLNYGYIINIGCQNFAIESVEKLIVNLETYLKNPSETEKKWFSGTFLK